MSLSAETAIQSVRDEMNRLRGRLFGAVETMGLPPKQEAAAKRLVRTHTYDAQTGIEATIRGEG